MTQRDDLDELNGIELFRAVAQALNIEVREATAEGGHECLMTFCPYCGHEHEFGFNAPSGLRIRDSISAGYKMTPPGQAEVYEPDPEHGGIKYWKREAESGVLALYRAIVSWHRGDPPQYRWPGRKRAT